MRRVVTHPLLWVVVVILALYAFFAYGLQPPMPRSLLLQFMVFTVIGVLMVATFDDVTYERLVEPFRLLLGHPRLRWLRLLALLLVVGGSASLAYSWAKPSFEAPVELRSVHPAPPTTIRIYDKTFNLVELRNPLREDNPKGSEGYRALVAEGAEIYYKNCLYCHGDDLDGDGVFAYGFNPQPANFRDVGTIAQLQESYVFWRITTGGPGLPREGAPWLSAMPVWEEMLDEEEVWKAILFLYDYTGFEPRSWELAETGAVEETPQPDPVPSGEAAAGEVSRERAEELYLTYCAQCHGREGDGQGPVAEFLYPKPRDFTLGVFKYKTTHADSEFPYDEDLKKTIREGLPGTAMPGWGKRLKEPEIDALVRLIKEFGEWDEDTPEDLGLAPIELGERVEPDAASLARGRELFEKACVQCHGAEGRGNVTSGKKLKDDWGDRIWPRNLTRPSTWRWTKDAEDVFQRISTGIRGTPMPEHTTEMSERQRWDIANYVMTLRDKAVPLSAGETVVRGLRIDGPLPEDPDDPAWEEAPAVTFALLPNVIKEPRLFHSLNDRVTVRVLFNAEAMAMRLDVDDRTYSVPGDPLEKQYRRDGVEPTRDAVAVQFPTTIPTTSEKPWFRHGDPKNPVNIWYWRAPSIEPPAPEEGLILDARGPDGPPSPRDDSSALRVRGEWSDGQWRVVFRRPLETADGRDIRFEAGRYIPVAFANWDGWDGQQGSRHTLTGWYWLLLEPEEDPIRLYGTSGLAGLLAGLLFLAGVRAQRRRFDDRDR